LWIVEVLSSESVGLHRELWVLETHTCVFTH